MELLETRRLLSLSLSILEGVDGFPVAAKITSDNAADVILAIYDPLTQRVTVNPDHECLLLDAATGTVLIEGGGGNDLIQVRGGGGAVQFVVQGGDGDDTVSGSNGHDWLEGGVGDDWIAGALGADYLAGGPGNDSLFGGSGNDMLIGEAGVDALYGGRGFDQLDEDVADLVRLGEALATPAATPPDVVLDPNEIVTPPCPPECPPGWGEI